MQPTPTLLAASSLVALLSPGAFAAEDVALSFDLSQPDWAEAQTSSLPAPVADVAAAIEPLPIPAHAAHPPMRYHSPEQLPAGVYRRAVAVALSPSTSATALVPPAPPPLAPPVAAAPPPPIAPAQKPVEAATLALDFGLAPSPTVLVAQAELARPRPPANPLPGLFEGDSDSLVAWAVGSAEGTRTPTGAINRAYFGHNDPGNRVWNMGTFSYQHGAQTPEEADRKQLARLQNQAEVLRQRARQQGLNLTLEETLNGLDLANQSPLAAIGRVGYIERLVEAKQNGLEGAEAILVARTRSYINPNTGRWNAPGLGNTEASIGRDQKRRADMVAQAIAAYAQQNPEFPAQAWVLEPAPEATTVAAAPPPEPVDDIFTVWTAPSDPPRPSDAPVAKAEPAAVAEQAIAEATADSGPGDRLAALWQLTVDRLATQADQADLPQAAAIAGFGMAEPSAAPALEAEEVAETPEAAAEPLAIAPSSSPQPAAPAWADTREGSQSTAALSSLGQGAAPESTIYVPSAAASPPIATAEAAAAAPEVSTAAAAIAPEDISATPSPPPSPETAASALPTASSEIAPTAPSEAAPGEAATAAVGPGGEAVSAAAAPELPTIPGPQEETTLPGAPAAALSFARADAEALAPIAAPNPSDAESESHNPNSPKAEL